MKEEARRAVVYAAIAQVTGRPPTAVYSYAEAKHVFFSGDARSFYDHGASAHVSATGGSLYHHGLGGHISLNIRGASFNGYDYSSGDHFSGSVRGSAVQLYDYGSGGWLKYSG